MLLLKGLAGALGCWRETSGLITQERLGERMDRRLEILHYAYDHVEEWLPQILDCERHEIAGCSLKVEMSETGVKYGIIELPLCLPGNAGTVKLVPYNERSHLPLCNYVCPRGDHKATVLILPREVELTRFACELMRRKRMRCVTLGNSFERWYEGVSDLVRESKGQIEI